MLTISALFYGDHARLASRCLGSLASNLASGRPFVGDIRLGLNEVSRGVDDYIQGWAEEAAIRFALPILVYRPQHNALKYPLMRKMVHVPVPGHPLGDYLMWFDDDAYMDRAFPWRAMLEFAADKAMIGHLYYWIIQGQQSEWVKLQPWHNPAAGPPLVRHGKPMFRFAQGSWWVLRSEVLRKYDWPPQALKHNGGDALLGELLRQQGLVLGHFPHRVHVNADDEGRNSKAKRRGYREPPLGADLAASLNVDTSFQHFDLALRVYSKDGWSDSMIKDDSCTLPSNAAT